jgi:predicted enzyme related to lactoylglutathione lyase
MADPDLHAPGRFCWVDLSTLDLERARRFYTSVFDWETVEVETGDAPPYLMFTQDDKIVAGLSELDDDLKKQGIPATWNHYVAVENADETAERVEELGGSMVVPVMQVLSAGRLGFLTDPTGAALGIWEAEEHGGFEIVTEANSVCWHESSPRATSQEPPSSSRTCSAGPRSTIRWHPPATARSNSATTTSEASSR